MLILHILLLAASVSAAAFKNPIRALFSSAIAASEDSPDPPAAQLAHAQANTARDTSRSVSDFLKGIIPSADLEKRQSTNTTAVKKATVQLCTEPGFAGECVNVAWPIHECIGLRGFAGHTQSFFPTDGYYCLLMQGHCDATIPYVQVTDSEKSLAGNLASVASAWLADSTSYMCFAELAQLRRFVRLQRLRVNAKMVQ